MPPTSAIDTPREVRMTESQRPDNSPCILMGHGAGGRLTQELIDEVMRPFFRNQILESHHDSAVFTIASEQIAMTTDSFVVHPLFFPGGDIGKLSVFGSVNDLAMAGARPRALSLSLIMEEGLPMETLKSIIASIAATAEACKIPVVTGDTKVVEKGHGHQLYINTSAVGEIHHGLKIQPTSVRPGDAIIVNGDLGRHQAALMVARHQFQSQDPIESDCADLGPSIMALLDENLEIHCLRDLTRGGLAAVLNEIATVSRTSLEIQESQIPVYSLVQSFADILGIDPTTMACEGRFALFLPAHQSDRACTILKKVNPLLTPKNIGIVRSQDIFPVAIQTIYGTHRILPMPQGELLPRIC